MKKINNKTVKKDTGQVGLTADSIGVLAEKILDDALCLIDKRLSFASENTKALDELIDYVESLEKEEMSRTQKNALIQKINDLKLNKLSEITSIVAMCKDKLNARETDDGSTVVFKVDYGDYVDEIRIDEGLNGN